MGIIVNEADVMHGVLGLGIFFSRNSSFGLGPDSGYVKLHTFIMEPHYKPG